MGIFLGQNLDTKCRHVPCIYKTRNHIDIASTGYLHIVDLLILSLLQDVFRKMKDVAIGRRINYGIINNCRLVSKQASKPVGKPVGKPAGKLVSNLSSNSTSKLASD